MLLASGEHTPEATEVTLSPPPQVRNVRGRQVEKELRDQKVEHQLLLQCSWEVSPHVRRRRLGLHVLTPRFLQLERERDDLLRRQKDAVLELQQKMGLKEQLLQRKMEELRETLEKREAQLYAVLSAASLDPSAARDAASKLQVHSELGPAPIHWTPTYWAVPHFRTFWRPKEPPWRPCRWS